MNTARHHPLLDHWLVASPAAFASLRDTWAALSTQGLLPLRLQAGLAREVATGELAAELAHLAKVASGTSVHVVVDRFGTDHDAALSVMRELPLDIHLHEWLEDPMRVATALGTPDIGLARQLESDALPAPRTAQAGAWLNHYIDALVRWAGQAREEFGSDAVDSRWPASRAGWLQLLGLELERVRLRLTAEAANDNFMRRAAGAGAFEDNPPNEWRLGPYVGSTELGDFHIALTIVLPHMPGSSLRIRLASPHDRLRPNALEMDFGLRTGPPVSLTPLDWRQLDDGSGMFRAVFDLPDDEAGTLRAAVAERMQAGDPPGLSIPGLDG